MSLVTSHFKDRFYDRNPMGNFNHFYACMKRNELPMLKSIPIDRGRVDDYFQYVCPISNIEYVALRRSGEVCGEVWVTFMMKEMFIEKQLQMMSSYRKPTNRMKCKQNIKKTMREGRYFK